MADASAVTKLTDASKAAEKVAKTTKKTDAEKRADFRRLAANRVSSALAKIKPIGSLANPTAYRYSKGDIDFIERALNARVSEVTTRLRSALEQGKAATKMTEFELPE